MFANASPPGISLSGTSRLKTPNLSLLPDAPDLALRPARVHEACGPARQRFALWLAARLTGPVIWIAPDWSRDRLNPCGLLRLLDPARLIHISPRRPEDILWSMEEVLRAGAVTLAVGELPQLPTLTQVRRMHLACETGAREGAGHIPTGLLLTPGEGGAPGVETRWHLAPDHADVSGHWRLRRLRARTAPEATWHLRHQGQSPFPSVTSDPALA